jgi:hypothetical protein
MTRLKASLHLGCLLALATFSTRSAQAALVYYTPSTPGNELMWNAALAGQALSVTTDPLSTEPENTVGSGTINSSELLWSSPTISISHDVLNAFGLDYAQVVEGSHVEISTHPDNVIAISPGIAGLGPYATSFAALGFHFEKTASYAVNIFIKTASSANAFSTPGLGANSSGFWGYVADDPDDYVEAIYFVQSNWPGPGTPEFRISNIGVSPVPEPSALLLTVIAAPLVLRRRRVSI